MEEENLHPTAIRAREGEEEVVSVEEDRKMWKLWEREDGRWEEEVVSDQGF